ncbi:MAG: hypothetical protein WCI03_10835, partial [bacterium]
MIEKMHADNSAKPNTVFVVGFLGAIGGIANQPLPSRKGSGRIRIMMIMPILTVIILPEKG